MPTSTNALKRLKNMGNINILLGIAVAITFFLPWYAFNYEGQVKLSDTTTAETVDATKQLTGIMLGTLGASSSPLVPPIQTILGIPTVFILTLGILTLGYYATRTGSLLLAAAGIVIFQMNMTAYSGLRLFMESPHNGGDYIQPLTGVNTFALLMYLTLGLTITITYQCHVYKKAVRHEKKKAEGRENDPTLLDMLKNFNMKNLAAIIAAATNENNKTSNKN